MKFSEKIMKLRRQKGLSQEEFANRLNISRQAIYKWETEQSVPDIKNVQEISKIFNVSIEYLLNDNLDEENAQKKVLPKKSKKTIVKNIFKFLVVLLIIYFVIVAIKFCLLTIVVNKAVKNQYSQTKIIRYKDVYYDELKHEVSGSVNMNKYIINNQILFFGEDSSNSNNIKHYVRYINLDNKTDFILNENDNNEYIYSDERNDSQYLTNNNANHDSDNSISYDNLPVNLTEKLEICVNPLSYVLLNKLYWSGDNYHYLYTFNNDGMVESIIETSSSDHINYYSQINCEYLNNAAEDNKYDEDYFIQFACEENNIDFNTLKTYIEKQK